MAFFLDRQRNSEALDNGLTTSSGKNSGRKETGRISLRGAAAIACLLLGTTPNYALAQQEPSSQQAASPAPDLPAEPTPNYTQPLYMRPTDRDFTKPYSQFPNPFAPYKSTSAAAPRTANSPRLEGLVRNGKIYLSLSDAILLALENNYDIGIQRYNLDIADTDVLRSKAGSTLNGVSSGLVTNTLGGSGTTLGTGGGPGGSSVGAGGAGSGTAGIVLTTNGAGPLPEQLDPALTGTIQYERSTTPESTKFLTGTNTLSTNTAEYNFGYTQGFLTGTGISVTYDNNRSTTNSINNAYSPQLQSNFKAQLTQHLLNGFGPGINGRFILQAKNNRRIADSAFRQQILYTTNQVEQIYWGLVSAYEDVQAKERALEQSKQLSSDNRKQLEIGTLAPLDVVQSDSSVATDQQSLITSQSNLEYQQLIIKQAISRNLSDPALINAPVIPTDRISLLEMPEEKMPTDDLVKQAIVNRPEIEQAILTLRNDEIGLKGAKNGLLPIVDAYAFYGSNALGGSQNPKCVDFFTGSPCAAGTYPSVGFGSVTQNLFNNSNPDKGIGVNITIPIRNRTAQAEQARSVLEYRQAEMRLEQLYVQIRMQVVNAQFALTNDRAQVQAALAAREYARQSLDAEQKKYRLGASTTANVLSQQRSLAIAENNVLSAQATYAIGRASLNQLLANTLDRYGISLADAVTGEVKQVPVIPGLEPAQQLPEPKLPGQQERLQQQEQQLQQPPPPPVMPPSTTPPQQ